MSTKKGTPRNELDEHPGKSERRRERNHQKAAKKAIKRRKRLQELKEGSEKMYFLDPKQCNESETFTPAPPMLIRDDVCQMALNSQAKPMEHIDLAIHRKVIAQSQLNSTDLPSTIQKSPGSCAPPRAVPDYDDPKRYYPPTPQIPPASR